MFVELVKLKNINLETRFWSKVNKTNNCWEWTGSSSNGYGYFRINKDKTMSAHRFSWKLHKGSIPTGTGHHGTCVLHICDNRKCVNPKHLFLGTIQDNVDDMYAKNRQVTLKREEHNMAKLTQKEVDVIRIIYDLGSVTQRKIAKMFGVSQTDIHYIINNKIWDKVK